MITEIIGIFALGILSDVLATLYYIFVGRLQGIPASLMTLLITLLNFFIIEKVVLSTNWNLILIYAFGCAVGCFSIVLLQKSKLKKNSKK